MSATSLSSEVSQRPNRLIHEKSPYLLQHAYNPVDWYPWGAEAFEKAKREDKPMFLSIGYSTCHWCHVMAHESFENPEIARLMNQWFVCIKVDREEHPDVDQVYMHAVTMLTGHGGWPLTVFLTPERKPFFGGTYFPPQRRWDMTGMNELLPAVAEAWKTKREEIRTSSEQIAAALHEQLTTTPSPARISVELLQNAFHQAITSFDPSTGGFGPAPKFPRSPELSLLLHYWARTHTAEALEMVTTTLDHMARGGLYDHLGGGFHRYSTDAQWLVPHFEKMLYDQALLAGNYVSAYRATQRTAYATVARGIFEYVLRDLTDPAGGFYAAEDADSEGVEGKFYVWTPDEIRNTLGVHDAQLFCQFYGVRPEGNFEHGTSILHIEQPIEDFAKLKHLDPQQLAQQLSASREALFLLRQRRVRPHRDDKILTSWNGLMIAALAEGAAALNEPRYLHAAQRAAEFILAHLQQEGHLLRRYRDGEAKYLGTLEDNAFFLDGLIALYEASFDPRWLMEAKRLASSMVTQFWDAQGSGFFLRAQQDEPLIVRSKESSDGATPSGNSVAALALLKLSRLIGDQDLETYARKTLDVMASRIAQTPFGYPYMLMAVDFALGPTKEIVIAGDSADASTTQMLRAIRQRFLPRVVVLLHPLGAAGTNIEAVVPYLSAQRAINGKATAYVCEQFVCQRPTTDLAAFVAQLEAISPR